MMTIIYDISGRGGRGRGGAPASRSGAIQQYKGTKVTFDDDDY